MLKNIPFYASLLDREEKPTVGMVLIYGSIEAHSFGEKGCIASNKTIGTECGVAEQTAANSISKLKKIGWIKVITDENNHRILIEPLLTINSPYRYSEPPLLHQVTPLTPRSNIEYSNKNTVIDNIYKENKKPKKSIASKEQELLELVNNKLKRKFRVLPNGIKKTINTFSLQEISRALDIMLLDNWHRDKIGDLKLDYILRASTIDSMLTRKSFNKIGTTVETKPTHNKEPEHKRAEVNSRAYQAFIKKRRELLAKK